MWRPAGHLPPVWSRLLWWTVLWLGQAQLPQVLRPLWWACLACCHYMQRSVPTALLYRCYSPLCNCCAGLTALCVKSCMGVMALLCRFDSPLCDCCTSVTALCVTAVRVWQPFVWLLYRCDSLLCDLCRFDSPLCDGRTGVTAVLCRCDNPLCDCCTGVTACCVTVV